MVPARILVVDDTSDVLTLVCRVLEGQGYQVLAASDGNAAMAACERVRGEIDLLLTDISMPGMTGLEVCQQIRADRELRELRVIAYTAHVLLEEQQRFLAGGFDDVLLKPINFQAVQDLIMAQMLYP